MCASDQQKTLLFLPMAQWQFSQHETLEVQTKARVHNNKKIAKNCEKTREENDKSLVRKVYNGVF